MTIKSFVKRTARTLLPARCRTEIRRRLGIPGNPGVKPAPRPEWSYRPEGWKNDSDVPGWDSKRIAELQQAKWNDFLTGIEGPGSLGMAHEAPVLKEREHLWGHNLNLSYGYVLATAARHREEISILDWGGGLGHYYPLSQALLPGSEIRFQVHDVPALCETGHELLPEVTFSSNSEDWHNKEFDLVMAGGSFWYAEDWKSFAKDLANSTQEYLYITRIMMTDHADTYVIVQCPELYENCTEVQSWVFNQGEFLSHVESLGLRLQRVFYFGAGPTIEGVPEQGIFRGFLFRKDRS